MSPPPPAHATDVLVEEACVRRRFIKLRPLADGSLPIAKGDLTGPIGPCAKPLLRRDVDLPVVRYQRAYIFVRQSRSGGARDDAGIANPLPRYWESLALSDACVEPLSR